MSSITANVAQTATFNVYGDCNLFINDAGPGIAIEQDFFSYTNSIDMNGVEFLPGVSASTNLDSIEIFGSQQRLYIIPRNSYEAYYDITFTEDYYNIGLDIEAYNSEAPSPGFWQLNFADGDFLEGSYAQTGSESDPMFLGIISDTALTSIRWYEPPELDFSCCEETALDDFITISSEVPLSASLPLLISGLCGLLTLKQRRRPT